MLLISCFFLVSLFLLGLCLVGLVGILNNNIMYKIMYKIKLLSYSFMEKEFRSEL